MRELTGYVVILSVLRVDDNDKMYHLFLKGGHAHKSQNFKLIIWKH